MSEQSKRGGVWGSECLGDLDRPPSSGEAGRPEEASAGCGQSPTAYLSEHPQLSLPPGALWMCHTHPVQWAALPRAGTELQWVQFGAGCISLLP